MPALRIWQSGEFDPVFGETLPTSCITLRLRSPLFVHPLCVPLSEVCFTE